MHRMGGILKIKKKEMTFTQKDGTVIQVERLGDGDRDYWVGRDGLVRGWFTLDSPAITGVATYPDGRSEEYLRGKPMSYWDQKRREEDAKKAAEEAKEKAKKDAEEAKNRKFYIQKWGFYPGDGTLGEAIRVGRPWGALENFFVSQLLMDYGSSKCYKLFYKYDKSCTVWVSNGKVTSVHW
mgnify:CR=1 FL=1